MSLIVSVFCLYCTLDYFLRVFWRSMNVNEGRATNRSVASWIHRGSLSSLWLIAVVINFSADKLTVVTCRAPALLDYDTLYLIKCVKIKADVLETCALNTEIVNYYIETVIHWDSSATNNIPRNLAGLLKKWNGI